MPTKKSCRHRRLNATSDCKDCGEHVDLRPKRNKYGAIRENGFDSRKEYRRYQELLSHQQAALISCLEAEKRLLRYSLDHKGVHIGVYEADFRYLRMPERVWVVEDVKSPATRTREYKMKKALMKACHGVEIQEV